MPRGPRQRTWGAALALRCLAPTTLPPCALPCMQYLERMEVNDDNWWGRAAGGKLGGKQGGADSRRLRL